MEAPRQFPLLTQLGSIPPLFFCLFLCKCVFSFFVFLFLIMIFLLSWLRDNSLLLADHRPNETLESFLPSRKTEVVLEVGLLCSTLLPFLFFTI